ncbi:MAG TPA: AsmA-like C-terminal region-containing protein [Candidatus Acidoferrales bacterium]|nr:AsmA-like C-terminal region-containing protein [Candidatus Acidoferrales bacterium]
MTRSARWTIVLTIIISSIGIVVSSVIFAFQQVRPHARGWVEHWLEAKYESDVDLAEFDISVWPRVHVEGAGLVLRYHGRTDLPPLLAIRRFHVDTSLRHLFRVPRHVDHVYMEGMQINLPPRGSSENPMSKGAHGVGGGSAAGSIVVDEIVAEKVILMILPKKKENLPQDYDISRLAMHSGGPNGSMKYHAILSNPVPPGDIISTGTFGPWSSAEPSATPVTGDYTYQRADLSVFHGIGGILSSQGKFTGPLDTLEVEGTTDTPDFVVTSGGHKIHLTTKFTATVDGTNGDTRLEPVEASFRNTVLVTSGSVEGKPGQHGKTIALDLSSRGARLEDLLRLAVKGEPTMTGAVRLNTKFLLPPGAADISDRLFLDGSFQIDAAHFTNPGVQQKFDQLSNRSRGQTGDDEQDYNVASGMKGKFRLVTGQITFSGLNFHVPGAEIELAGTYGIDQGIMDFHGRLFMDAKLSQTMSGPKSFFAKVLDPFFSKNGHGTVLPIKITGTVDQPQYGLDFHRKKEEKEKEKAKEGMTPGARN